MRNVTLLVVLDGFGHNESPDANAIAHAHTPVWDRFWSDQPHTLISGSGVDVGLPENQMGNSEVGHMNLGAGRVVQQEFSRINRAIEDGSFADNPTLKQAYERVATSGGVLHVMGLLSPGGVHSHEQQIFTCLESAAASGVERVYLHAFLDGRDTPPKSALASLEVAEATLARLEIGHVASICGRYFAMDRDNRWDRVNRAYNLLVRGEAPFHANSATAALELAYRREETDEFVQPTAIHGLNELPVTMQDGDAVVFMNFRADRARELTRAIIETEFAEFARRSTVKLVDFVTLTRYADDIDTSCAFETPVLVNTLGEYLANKGMRQLRIAETEKYAHVTFFFSGGHEALFEGEHRVLVPSPKVSTYDLQPEMSAPEVTDELVEAISTRAYDIIICNYANCDMVGHTGNFEAAVKAVEALDVCLGRVHAALTEVDGQMLITADHGNVERMYDEASGQAHTAHTREPVPLVYVGRQQLDFASGGTLSDVAPTLLALMQLETPVEMTGRSLANIKEPPNA
ncbi:MAG: 2,3-bisphosphoglycerate-independent phosphoglycerate mutase [Gammaproteobacteria bacterium]|nr:2,3-bisphosphoglycerate-independent phosphoglycerate mutase [Gammaproteobacteria bacterium]